MRSVPHLAAVLCAIALLESAGAGAGAGPASAQPPAGSPPAVPTELTVTGGGEAATLTWRQPPGTRATSFRVYEGAAVVARNTTTSASLTNLGFARTRTYTVTAVDARGRESAPSTPISRTLGISGVPPMCLPAAITGLTVSRVTSSGATLSWAHAGDPSTVTVSGGPGGPVSTTASGVRIGGLAPGSAYTFAVVRFPHCSGLIAPPTTVTVTTAPGAPGAPAPPVSPTVTGRTDTTLTLAWAPPTSGTVATRYVVYHAGRPVATTSGTSATVPGLYHAAPYTFQIAALDAQGGESAAIAVGGTTATCQARPPRPVAVTAEPLSASSVRLTWVYDAAATSFTVYTGDRPVGASAGSTVVVGGLASATSYPLRVAATLTNGCGRSPASAAVGVTTLAGPTGRPAQPTDFLVASGDPFTNQVTLRWTQPAGGDPAVSYRVYRGADVLSTSDATVVVLRLPAATTQVLTVAAVNAAGLESTHSALLTVRVPYLPPP